MGQVACKVQWDCREQAPGKRELGKDGRGETVSPDITSEKSFPDTETPAIKTRREGATLEVGGRAGRVAWLGDIEVRVQESWSAWQ